MNKFQITDLLNLKKLVTPSVLTVVYWVVMVLAILCVLISGVLTMSNGVISGLLTIVIGVPLTVLYVRVCFEIAIVMFNINDNLQRIADRDAPAKTEAGN